MAADLERVKGASLEVVGLAFGYGRKHESVALADVSFQATIGATAILGPNGAGKSTLFRVLSGTLRPTSGRFQLGELNSGNPAELDTYRRMLGAVPQRLQIRGSFSSREFLEYTAWIRGIPADDSGQEIEDALEACALVDVGNVRVRQLSGGMIQRLSLAQALIGRPRLLLLDEATVGLDPIQRRDLLQQLGEIAKTTILLFATHLVEDVIDLAEHVVVINLGRVAFSGKLEELCGELGVSTGAVESAYRGLILRSST